VIRDLNQDFRINPRPGPGYPPDRSQNVVDSLPVGVSHFAEFREKRPVIVSEMLINVSKRPILQW